jgi:hypothetical protein
VERVTEAIGESEETWHGFVADEGASFGDGRFCSSDNDFFFRDDVFFTSPDWLWRRLTRWFSPSDRGWRARRPRNFLGCAENTVLVLGRAWNLRVVLAPGCGLYSDASALLPPWARVRGA